jgi:ubiquinone/menaquinone biosynthesis C-methylase UbiE
MAEAYPHARFVGFDFHAGSIEQARQRAEQAGWPTASHSRWPTRLRVSGADGGYDLVTFFDCLHDMGDPVGALRRTREVLAEGGAVMIVEPMAGDRPEDNFNPDRPGLLGRLGDALHAERLGDGRARAGYPSH